MTFPTEWKVIKFMFQTTNQFYIDITAQLLQAHCPFLSAHEVKVQWVQKGSTSGCYATQEPWEAWWLVRGSKTSMYHYVYININISTYQHISIINISKPHHIIISIYIDKCIWIYIHISNNINKGRNRLLSKNYLREEDKTIDIDIDVSCRPITGSGFEEFTDQKLLKSSPI